MNRYKYIIDDRIDTTKMRKRKNSSLPPKLAAGENDYYIIAREGDRLDNLAYEYYADASQWWVLAQANHLGKGTLVVPPGMRLRIPSKRELSSILKINESER